MPSARTTLVLSSLLLGLIACSRQDEPAPKGSATDSSSPSLPAKVTFNAHIRPIFSDTCFSCHGFDAKHRKADLRLDTPEGAYAKLKDSEDIAIVPGKPEESAVWLRVISNDPEALMPPPDFHKPLSERQKQLIKRWIEQGAVYEQHWAYAPIRKPAIPQLEKHASAVANPIDAFILKRLEQERIGPSPAADRATLLRRLSLDLIGLPPTPEELAAFLNDKSPDAYEKQVDRLLASPHYGERMAVQWLDVVRYADTVGLHGDQNQHIFPYRDYVIRAFNDNLPFDRFTIEQLAGDLLENPTDEQRIASGFIRLSQMTREGGAQPKEYLAKYASDRVRAIGAAWLGQTTGCAECHDHKFDPISTRDFYSLSAFFKDFKQWGVYSPYNSSPNPDIPGFNNESPFPPEIIIESPTALARIHELQTDACLKQAAIGQIDETWIRSIRSLIQQHPDAWSPGTMTAAKSAKATPAKTLDDQSLLLTGRPQDGDIIDITIDPADGRVHTIRLELLPHEANDGNLGRSENGGFSVKTPQFSLIRNGKPSAIEIAWAQADHYKTKNNEYDNGFQPLPLPKEWQTGNFPWTLPDNFQKRPHTAVFILKSPVDIQAGDQLLASIPSGDIGRLRISTTPFVEAIAGQPAAAPELLAAFQTNPDQRSPHQTDLLRGAWALQHAADNKLTADWPAIRKSIRDLRSGITRSLISLPIPKEEIPVTRVLPRGDWQNETGAIVEPAVPSFLPQPADAGKRRLNRLDLARWLVSKDNPLTARHTMNRLWKQFFGKGISNVLDDLGSQGEWPSHPELLDWLAATFRDEGWDVKRMVKLVVMSNTYRQQSAHREELRDIDPYNRLLAEQSARRLDAEFIRDNALAASGMLKAKNIGGPSVFPYQPPGYYAALQFPDRDYIPDTTGGQFRRSVYMHWQRTFLHPMLANFDAPSREECAADRLQSNSPLQALTLLNDPAAVEIARSFALDLLKHHDNDTDRIKRAYLRTLSREPEKAELESMLAFLQQQNATYQNQPKDLQTLLAGTSLPKDVPASHAAAWVQTCRALLNLHETITRY